MSLQTYPDIEQGSERWYDVRRGILTASVMGQLITPATQKIANNVTTRSITAELAAERITGFTDYSYASDDMIRGHDVEPLAVAAYSKHTDNPVTTLGFMVNDDHGFNLGCSPDGLVDDDGMIECKSRRPKKHLQTILADEVPAENMAQCQAALLVSGRDWVDYVSFSGGMPLYTKRVEPDEKWFRAIVAAATEFELAVTDMIATYRERVVGLPVMERIDYSRVELKLA
jgi:predicted phage-related endonuclease